MKLVACLSSVFLVVGVLSAENYQYNSSNMQKDTIDQYSSEVTIKVANNPELGKILTDGKGMTLYMFTPDKNISTCYGECAVTWPPLLSTSAKPTLAPGISGTLDTVNRDDNTSQVTYNGMPLYYYLKDKKPGDVYGQNVDNTWFVISPK